MSSGFSPHSNNCHCEECGRYIRMKDFRPGDANRACKCCVNYFVRYYDAAAPSSSETGEYQGSSGSDEVTGTPQKHTDTSYNLSEDRKTEVVNRSRYGQRCMMTRESMHGNRDNQFFHMVRRSTPKKKLNHLEPHWGKKLNTLNVDSSSNIGVIQANHHKAFDSGAFMFLPTTEVIQSIEAYVEQSRYKDPFDEKFNDDFWTYSFVPLSFNRSRSIFIKNINETEPSDEKDKFADAPGYRECSDLRNDPMLQAIESHIHPFCVTLNAGEKIVALEDAERMELFSREPRALRIREIYLFWMKNYPDEVTTEHPYGGGANEDGMSSLDEADIPSPTDIHEDPEQSMASGDEDLYANDVPDDVLRTNSPERGADDENTIFRALPPSTVTDSTATARLDDSAGLGHDFGPRHHTTSKSAVTAPAAFKLAGTRDVGMRVSNRYKASRSNYESPLHSKSLAGQGHSLGVPRHSGHTNDYGPMASMRREGSTESASSDSSAAQDSNDGDAAPEPRQTLEEEAGQIVLRPPKLKSTFEAQKVHHSIPGPMPRLDAGQTRSQFLAGPSSQMPPPALRSSSSLGYSGLPFVPHSEVRSPIAGPSTSGSASALPQTPTDTGTNRRRPERPTKRKRCRSPSSSPK